jgi:3-methyladenine DNA glycosylase/8-oxoguanine DNA glycosylase
MSQNTSLPFPKNFSFRQTVYSHGWCQLLPFELDEDSFVLKRVFHGAAAGTAFEVSLSHDKENIDIRIEGKPDKKSREKILKDICHSLRLDDDLGEFYALVKSDKELAWIAKHKAGRIMRSPTVFEVLVKTICTSNCNWSMTKLMTANLAKKLGIKTAAGQSAFPTPEAMAKKPVEFYVTEIKAGYRAAYLKELAEKVSAGKLDPESWLTTDMPAAELKKEMKLVKGVGDYAADNLLKLVGHYDGLALDSFLRAQFYKTHRAGKKCADKAIEKYYKRFGKWRGLVMWCDMTKEHIHDLANKAKLSGRMS